MVCNVQNNCRCIQIYDVWDKFVCFRMNLYQHFSIRIIWHNYSLCGLTGQSYIFFKAVVISVSITWHICLYLKDNYLIIGLLRVILLLCSLLPLSLGNSCFCIILLFAFDLVEKICISCFPPKWLDSFSCNSGIHYHRIIPFVYSLSKPIHKIDIEMFSWQHFHDTFTDRWGNFAL